MVSDVSGTAAAIWAQGSRLKFKFAAPDPPVATLRLLLRTMTATLSTVQAQLSSVDAFTEALDSSRVKDELKIWLKTEKIETLEDIALLTSAETSVDKDIIDMANAGGAKVSGAMEKVAVRRLWLTARGLYDQKTALTNSRNVALASPSVINLDQPLSAELQISTDAAWMQKHGFTLPTAHMVMASSLGPAGRGRGRFARGGGSAKTVRRRMERLHGRDTRRVQTAYEEGRRDDLHESLVHSTRGSHKEPLVSPEEAPVTAAAPAALEPDAHEHQQVARKGPDAPAVDEWPAQGQGWQSAGGPAGASSSSRGWSGSTWNTGSAVPEAWASGWRTGAQFDKEAADRPGADGCGAWPIPDTWQAGSWKSGWL